MVTRPFRFGTLHRKFTRPDALTMNRAEMLQRFHADASAWDVLIIGGGATGLGAAVEAAARGHRTALVEQGDFAQATSSRSTKLIHGGIRYLKRGQLPLVRESLRERGRLLRNAPHLVRPLPFIVPNYAWWERPYFGTGLKLYDWLAGDLGLGASKHLSRAETLAHIPTLEAAGLRGGICYHDGQFDDARLAITLARTAADLNGVVVNYLKVVSLLKENHRVCGAVVRDLETGNGFELRARVVINATGVFTDELRRLDDAAAPTLLTLSQGAHLILDKSFLPGDCALMSPHTADGRVFFAIPWRNRTLIGTTETPVTQAVLEPHPLNSEIEFLLAHAGRHLTRKPVVADVLSVFAGLRPLVKADSGKATSTLSRSHRVIVSSSGLVTITGGKWTTYRQMAEDAMDRATAVGNLPVKPSPTANLKLHGWRETSCRRRGDESQIKKASETPHVVAGNFDEYGADAEQVRALCDITPNGNTLLHPRLPFVAGEVIWAVRHEMARTLEDLLARRLRALPMDARASLEIAPHVARLMATELGRDAAWENQQVSKFQELAGGYLCK